MSSTLVKRIVSAVILAPIFLGVIYLGDYWLFALLFLSFSLSIYEWYGLSRKTIYFAQIFSLGLIYIFLSYCSFYALREAFSKNVIYLFIGMIWFSDVGAYFTGKTLGGPKLIQRISPNKTWSGFGGAMFFPAIFCFFWVWQFGLYKDFSHNSLWIMLPLSLIIGAVIGSVGQAGDLMVSFVKRMANVKDTGTLIPGHGGLLDRINSMLLGAPVFFLMLSLMSYVL